ncbi:RWD domain-containing protein 2A, partial [Stegodyphus mimosarum]
MNVMEVNASEDTVLSYYFELQLSEIEMLSSMYPDSNEFSISLPSAVADMNRFITGKTRRVPTELDFTLNLHIPDVKDKLEVNVIFPHEYPAKKPHICARSTGLSRALQKELNSAISDFISSQPEGDLCMITFINWVTEIATSFFSPQTSELDAAKNQCEERNIFCRMWIYSHHIFSKFKRREIVDCGQDLNLTGFSLPGKPGFICIEGRKRDCYEFLQHLKHMSWKKISLVKEETEEINESSVDSVRRFDGFQEISFHVRRGPA